MSRKRREAVIESEPYLAIGTLVAQAHCQATDCVYATQLSRPKVWVKQVTGDPRLPKAG